MKAGVIAIDDEPPVLKLVKGYIEKTSGFQLMGTYDNPLDAIEFLLENTADIINKQKRAPF